MKWIIEYTDEFEGWWGKIVSDDRKAVDASVILLETYGPSLPFPHSTKVAGTKRFHHLRELRVQSRGKPLRVLYAFDPRRTVILLLGGDKTGDKRWYKVNVPIAERLYQKHLSEIAVEERGNGKEI
jgi:hypothetical protein